MVCEKSSNDHIDPVDSKVNTYVLQNCVASLNLKWHVFCHYSRRFLDKTKSHKNWDTYGSYTSYGKFHLT